MSIPNTETYDQMLSQLGALADANRLRMVGFLAIGPLSVEQLSGHLGVGMSTTSHHLRRLSEAGLVEGRPQGHHVIYRLRPDSVAALGRRLAAPDTLPALALSVSQAADQNGYDRKVLKTFLGADGRITAFPTQQKKELAILRHVLKDFEPGRRYTERQMNERLRAYSDDTARLRRGLVQHGLMAREGGSGAYWRTEPAQETQHGPHTP